MWEDWRRRMWILREKMVVLNAVLEVFFGLHLGRSLEGLESFWALFVRCLRTGMRENGFPERSWRREIWCESGSSENLTEALETGLEGGVGEIGVLGAAVFLGVCERILAARKRGTSVFACYL